MMRRAIMHRAHRSYFTMNWKGPSDWTFARCLRLAHYEINGKRDAFVFAQLEREMRRLVKERASKPDDGPMKKNGRETMTRSPAPPDHSATHRRSANG